VEVDAWLLPVNLWYDKSTLYVGRVTDSRVHVPSTLDRPAPAISSCGADTEKIEILRAANTQLNIHYS